MIIELIAFVKDVNLWSLSGRIGYQIYLCCLVALMMVGVYAYFVQFSVGLSVTNMSNIVSWGFYISNFTFLVGVAAAAVMIILPSYIFKDKDLHKVVIIGEVVAIGALVMCLTFVFVDLGGPLKAWHMVPAIINLIMLFSEIFKLIVPGLVPSPLGEVVSYAPSWVEVGVTVGVLALGIFVVTLYGTEF